MEELESFMGWLYGIHPDLNFTYEYSTEGVVVLDDFIYSVGHMVHTTQHSKPSDTHCYLIPTSCHKMHVLKNIPRNIARRLRMNNSEDHNFIAQRKEYSGYLLERGYHQECVGNAFDEFSDIGIRKSLYAEKIKVSDDDKCNIPLVIDNNPALPNMGRIIHKHKHLLNLDPVLKSQIPQDAMFVSHLKNKTIGDMLIHNRFRSSETKNKGPGLGTETHAGSNTTVGESQSHTGVSQSVQPSVDMREPGCYACGKCYVCRFGLLTPCSSYTSYHTDQVFSINKVVSCQSTNLIYLAECVTCEQSDIGYATTNLPLRVSNHKCHIKKKKRSCRLVCHFLDIDHNLDFSTHKLYNESLSKHLKFIVIDVKSFDSDVSKDDKIKAMETMEGFYQTQLKSLVRFGGMNVLDSNNIVYSYANYGS